MPMASKEDRWCVVTGGRGFAGRHLVEMLIDAGNFRVRIADLAPTIDLEPSEENGLLGQALSSGRANYVSVDVRNKDQVLKAVEGVKAVFHMAAPDSSINNLQLHRSVNVDGTKNVIEACVESKVKRLIYTSSPSVVFDGVHGVSNGDESIPFPDKHNDHYSATKAKGEALVIKANGVKGLLTCCIRPGSIFGPGDKLFVPSIAASARSGKSKFIIGDGKNMYDFTYVGNVAHAHICAERALALEGEVSEKAAGQVYLITNLEPVNFWEFVSLILEGLGYERPSIKIPASVMMPIAHIVEGVYKLFGPYGMKVPQLTPSRVRLVSCSKTFNCSKAKERLGYNPIVTFKEGLKRTVESYQHLRAQVKSKREGPSKASICLGSGRIAETLLWKDRKQTVTALFLLVVFYFNFISSGFTIITALSWLLLAASTFLFINGYLPGNIFGYRIEKPSPSSFHLSKEDSYGFAASVAQSWNRVVNVLKLLSEGKDGNLFAKVSFFLLVLSFHGAFSLRSLFLIGSVVAFCAFVIYEKKEQEIDDMVLHILSCGSKLKTNIVKKLTKSKKDE